MADYDTFQSIDIRVGKIIGVQDFPEARKPAYKLTIDFGAEIGIKHSSAQVKKHYSKQDLFERLVLGVVNFAPRQIGPFMSEVLTLGTPDDEGECLLIQPSEGSVMGGRLY